jgi:hypothetical protein
MRWQQFNHQTGHPKNYILTNIFSTGCQPETGRWRAYRQQQQAMGQFADVLII